MKRLIFLLVFLGLISGVLHPDGKNYIIEEVNGVKVYKNQDKPSVEGLVISPRKIFEIRGTGVDIKDKAREFEWPRSVDIDSKGNIFILDTQSASIKKFSQDGTFITTFGRRGSGPDEMSYPPYIVILNDVVYAADPYEKRILKFDTAGKYLDNIKLKTSTPNFVQKINDDKVIGYLSQDIPDEGKEDSFTSFFNLHLMNNQFESIAILNEYKRESNPAKNDFIDRYTAYAIGTDKIFVAENSETRYRINVFDFNGKQLYAIEKEYTAIKFSKEELEELNTSLKNFYKRFQVSANVPPIEAEHKKAISGIYCDKEGQLLVASSVERNENNRWDFLVDVFKDGVFLKKVKLDILKGHDYVKIHDEKIFFKGNRIYHVDEPTSIVSAFEY